MSEAAILSAVRIALSKAGLRVFRNNCGQTFPDGDGRIVRYGVANPGGSDLIGWQSVLVTPDMVGARIAVFVACEVKDTKGRPTRNQQNFLDQVHAAGGIAMLARSAEDAVTKLRENGAIVP